MFLSPQDEGILPKLLLTFHRRETVSKSKQILFSNLLSLHQLD